MKKVKKPLQERLVKFKICAKDDRNNGKEDADKELKLRPSDIFTPRFFIRLFFCGIGGLLLGGLLREFLAHPL